MKIFIYIVIGIVVATVIAGFILVGSPQEERLRRFDEQRVQNLQFIQSEIVNYWINKGQLPASLRQLKDDIRGISIPKDPQTNEDYTYNVRAAESFQLCANFARSSSGSAGIYGKPMAVPTPYGSVEQNWDHAAGYVCFERVIDPEIYKPAKLR